MASSEFKISKENKNLNVKANLVSRANLKNIQSTLDLFQINSSHKMILKTEVLNENRQLRLQVAKLNVIFN